MKVIGINGPARVGKDTAANYLVKEKGWLRLAFADNLKEMCASVFDLDLQLFHNGDLKEIPWARPKIFDRRAALAVKEWIGRTHPTVFELNDDFILLDKQLHSPREMIQYIGTEICRGFIKSYHVDIVAASLIEGSNYVLTDVRFPDEAGLAKSVGGYIINIYSDLIQKEDFRSHSSETSMGDWKFDYIINNSIWDINAFYRKIDMMLNTLGVD